MATVSKRKGRRGFQIDFFDAEGRRHRKQIGGGKRVAGEVLNDILSKKARQEYLGIIQDSDISFSDFAADVWLKRVAPTLKPSTAERWRGIVNLHLKPFFSGRLRAITEADAQAYISHRREQGASAGSINNETMCLKHLFRRACEWKGFIHKNPLRTAQGAPLLSMKALREPEGRTRFLSQEELDLLLEAMSQQPYLRAFLLVSINSGMRRNEVLSLTRSTVDWPNRLANVENTKSGKPAHVPLNDAALDALRSLPTRMDGRLFPYNGDQMSAAFKRAVQRAGIVNFRLHDLRHSYASNLAMDGASSRQLQALLRHSDPRMTSRYAHLSDQSLHNAVDRVQTGGSRPR
jgi:integrase